MLIENLHHEFSLLVICTNTLH